MRTRKDGIEAKQQIDSNPFTNRQTNAEIKHRRAIKVMLAQESGSIINIGSMAAIGGGPNGVAYAISEHGVVGSTLNTA